MKERFDLLGILFENHFCSFFILLLELRKRVEFSSHLELFWLNTIEVEENLVLLQRCKFGVPKAKVSLQ